MHLYGLINTTNDFPFVCYNSYFEEFFSGLEPFFFSLLLGLSSAEPKSSPESLFFKVVEQANAIFHLLEKHFTDCVIGLVA